MALVGHLTDYSLAEVFRFAAEGKKTGLLSLDRGNGLITSSQHQNYIWFQSGKIVAHAHNLTGHGLIDLAVQHCNLQAKAAEVLRQQSAYMFKPLGGQLQSQGLVNSAQLTNLFSVQVLQPLVALFACGDAAFNFDETAVPASSEMTGFSIPTAEVSLQGLRTLQDWRLLQAKLPEPEYGLQRLRKELPAYGLEPQEKAVWELADGHVTIDRIAVKCALPLPKTQQIAFRLVAIGLVKEVTLDCLTPDTLDSTRVLPNNIQPLAVPKSKVSKKFLNNLVGFLKQKR